MIHKLLPAMLGISLLAPAATYEIDPAHSSAQFSVKHMRVSNVRGEFGALGGTIVLDEGNLTASKIEATIDANSITTRNDRRDTHLRSPDFFDVGKFPTLTFVSKKFTRVGPAKYKVLGDLTIHGVTKEVTLDVDGPTPEVKDDRGNAKVGASAATSINRKDFGLNWNRALEASGVLVGDDVNITIEVEMTKKPSTT